MPGNPEKRLAERSIRAYLSRAKRLGLRVTVPPAGWSSVAQIKLVTGCSYVVLRNEGAALAVFRVYAGGRLRRLDSWPKSLGGR